MINPGLELFPEFVAVLRGEINFVGYAVDGELHGPLCRRFVYVIHEGDVHFLSHDGSFHLCCVVEKNFMFTGMELSIRFF
ncbi:hypothetical protein AN911_00580 [Mycobacteroides immunogenum]|uniref:Uncharacterized protein n=1 Tax=Mycobacteroides immunogenum TaxID=83262 RepID=A0A7V8LQW4_9MYCO|nr:hypothetical protein AN908_07050 [Mycobacteroides immunogenum]KPG24008.1 hypothetical protein AN911_00580 [Mycobacteroides immunogenum]KPG39049.1 hypothetical protein AN914_10135 [Mycobacteroides immunogenum]